jgi:CO/xanthine dehydrogenase FAD-binding subunit
LIHTGLINVGHPQTRNLGTVGGSLAHADPLAELPLLFLTLGGTLQIQSSAGEHQVEAADFFVTLYTTTLEPHEIVTKTNWRLPGPKAGVAFKEYRRRMGDFMLMGAACLLELDENEAVQSVRLGLGGVADRPILIEEAANLVGQPYSPQVVRELAETVVPQLDLPEDHLASASYRQQLARTMIGRILDEAYTDAKAKLTQAETYKGE